MSRARKTGIASGAVFDHEWHWSTRMPARKGDRCRILAERADGLLWIEFEDGHRVTCSRFAVRRIDPSRPRPARQLELSL